MRIGTWLKTFRVQGLLLAALALAGGCQQAAELSVQRPRAGVATAPYPTTPAYVATAAATDVYLRADTFVIPPNAFDNPTAITMWGFVITDQNFTPLPGYGPQVPGPALMATEGSTLTLHVRNNLRGPYTEAISLIIPGQVTPLNPVWFDPAAGTVTSGARNANDYRSRVRSFNPETPADNLTVRHYSFPNLRAGTYLYHSGTHPAVQMQMGLYGSLRVYPAGVANQAYGDPLSSFTSETTLVFSEIDPDFHAAIEQGHYGPVPNPNVPDWRTSAINYHPAFFLINGRPYTVDSPPLKGAAANGKFLIRFLNAGLQTKAPVVQGPTNVNSNIVLTGGAYMQVIAEDGNFISVTSPTGVTTAAPRNQYSVLLPAGKTTDAIINTPAAPPGDLVLHDRRLNLTNAGTRPGGMLAFLPVTGVPNTAQVVQSSLTSLSFTPTLRTRTVNILNNGLATRGIASVQMIGADPSMFSVSPQAAFSLTAGTLQTMTVTFTPTSTGTKTATLRLTTNDPATPVINVTLSGT
jgi:FtsP/CotA-like multicopper oxidase with cupredoxin domain